MNKRSTVFKWRWHIVMPVAVLVVSVALQAMDAFRQPLPVRAPHLRQTIPSAPEGWVGRDVPLGANEFITKVAEKTLNFDEVFYREYRRGAEYFTVYVAYWGAGKMPVQLVASHTPDRCWTENGWRCLAMKFHQSYVLEGCMLQPAEWRKFEPPDGGKAISVVFWHLVAGKAYEYGERFNSIPDPIQWGKNAILQAFAGNQEQYFIRVASSEPLEKIWTDPGVVDVFRGLLRLGLALHRTAGAT